MIWRHVKAIFDGSLDTEPALLTAVQSVIVTILAILMSAILWQAIGFRFPNVWYQVCAALFIASVLAPVFLYPSYRTSHRLRVANSIIRKQAHCDLLTGLPNSFALSEGLEKRLANLERDGGFAVHFVDINRLKHINDSLGHEVGNVVLQSVGNELIRFTANSGNVARFGGDVFVILQNTAGVESDATDFASRAASAVSKRYMIEGHSIEVSVTVGTALAPLHGDTPSRILRAADIALYRAKTRRTSGAVFHPKMAAAANRNRNIEAGLSQALERNELSLLFQPLVRRDNPLDVVAFEALLRWTLPDGTTISPDEFIPIAERTGAVVQIGEWVMHQACCKHREWGADVRVSVNISPVQIFRSDFISFVEKTLRETDMHPDQLELEITESVLIGDTTFIGSRLAELRDMGIRIALDDFGTGFCGLHYLRQFTIDKIKVDKSIIDDANANEKALNILRGVSSIASEIGMTVTVEGVDTIEKAELLERESCCDEVQGNLFSAPISSEMVPNFLSFLAQKKIHRHNPGYPAIRGHSRSDPAPL